MSEAPTILAIDPATRTGYAIQTIGRAGPPLFGAWDYSRVVSDSMPNLAGHRLEAFRADLGRTIAEYGISCVAYEEAVMGTHNHLTAAFHGEMRGVLKSVCARRGVECRAYNPMTIKAFWTGSGRAGKDAMMRACRTWIGVEVADPDAADAIAVLHLAMDEIRRGVPTREVRKRQAAKVRRRKNSQPTLFGRK